MFCPVDLMGPAAVSLISRDLDGAISTAESFKSWDTCMDNNTCKIVAIVLMVVAGLILFWVISSIARCLCCGVACASSFCCCLSNVCGACGGSSNDFKKSQQGYQQPGPGYQQPLYTNYDPPSNDYSYKKETDNGDLAPAPMPSQVFSKPKPTVQQDTLYDYAEKKYGAGSSYENGKIPAQNTSDTNPFNAKNDIPMSNLPASRYDDLDRKTDPQPTGGVIRQSIDLIGDPYSQQTGNAINPYGQPAVSYQPQPYNPYGTIRTPTGATTPYGYNNTPPATGFSAIGSAYNNNQVPNNRMSMNTPPMYKAESPIKPTDPLPDNFNGISTANPVLLNQGSGFSNNNINMNSNNHNNSYKNPINYNPPNSTAPYPKNPMELNFTGTHNGGDKLKKEQAPYPDSFYL